MVVTSRMLAAHTNGYSMDARSRFWSQYYRSLKEITSEDSSPRVSETMGLPRYVAPAPISYSTSLGSPSHPSRVFPPFENSTPTYMPPHIRL